MFARFSSSTAALGDTSFVLMSKKNKLSRCIYFKHIIMNHNNCILLYFFNENNFAFDVIPAEMSAGVRSSLALSGDA